MRSSYNDGLIGVKYIIDTYLKLMSYQIDKYKRTL